MFEKIAGPLFFGADLGKLDGKRPASIDRQRRERCPHESFADEGVVLSKASENFRLNAFRRGQPFRRGVLNGRADGEIGVGDQFQSVTIGENTTPINSALLTVQLNPGSGERLILRMKRYANPPTVLHPWHRAAIKRKN